MLLPAWLPCALQPPHTMTLILTQSRSEREVQSIDVFHASMVAPRMAIAPHTA